MLLATRALVFAILAMSLDILLGYHRPRLARPGRLFRRRRLSHRHPGDATTISAWAGISGWWCCSACWSAAALAAFFGLFAIRASGVYFLMITLALGQCVWGLAYRWNSLTGGDNGINVTARPNFGIDLTNERDVLLPGVRLFRRHR